MEIELTILMPCLNESETIRTCVRKAAAYLARAQIAGEVLIADNGSTDGSPGDRRTGTARASSTSQERGYGAALLGGIAAARGRYVIMGDADDSYDFSDLEPFVEQLRAGDRPGDGQPLPGRHRAGRHAAAAPLPRQPGAERASAACSSAPGRRLPLRPARLRPRRASWRSACADRAWSSPARWWCKAGARRAAHRRGADHADARTAARGRRTCAAGAMAGATCASCCCSARAGCSSIRAPY